MMNSIITHPTTPDLALSNSLLDRFPRLKSFRLPRERGMNQVQINVLVTPFRERFVDCVFCFRIPMVWITEFRGKEDLDINL